MSNYVKSTDFAAKDLLPKGDPSKKVVGAEIDTEFNNIQDSIQTKVDRVSGAISGNFPTLTNIGGLVDSGISVASLIKTLLPPGTVFPYAGDLTVPDGFLLCQGQAVSRNTYADLFLRIGTKYGTGDGTTTFNLPNLVGRVPIGAGPAEEGITKRDVGQEGGKETEILSLEHIPEHDHGGGDHDHTYSDRKYEQFGSGSGYATNAENITVSVRTSKSGNIIQKQGGGKAHNNMQPYLVMNYIIKY